MLAVNELHLLEDTVCALKEHVAQLYLSQTWEQFQTFDAGVLLAWWLEQGVCTGYLLLGPMLRS